MRAIKPDSIRRHAQTFAARACRIQGSKREVSTGDLSRSGPPCPVWVASRDVTVVGRLINPSPAGKTRKFAIGRIIITASLERYGSLDAGNSFSPNRAIRSYWAPGQAGSQAMTSVNCCHTLPSQTSRGAENVDGRSPIFRGHAPGVETCFWKSVVCFGHDSWRAN